jgi:hypothetical protein
MNLSCGSAFLGTSLSPSRPCYGGPASAASDTSPKEARVTALIRDVKCLLPSEAETGGAERQVSGEDGRCAHWKQFALRTRLSI